MASANQSSILTKCIRIIDLLADSRRTLGFSEIVQQSGIVKSSTHRILSILQAEGLVEYDALSRTYRLGPKLFSWARIAWQRNDLQQIAGPELESLCEITRMNVALSIFDKDSVLYLRTIDSIPVRYASLTGEHAPLHCTAVGKIFLAHMREHQRDDLLSRMRFERFTENSILTRKALLADLEETRQRGYGISLQEEFILVNGIAAPIMNSNGEVVSGISIWTLIDHHNRDDLIYQVPALLEASKRISCQLGYEGE